MTTSRTLASLLGLGVTAVFVVACGGDSRNTPTLRVATTTSVQNSGLMEHLRSAFHQASGVNLLAHSTGSGRALTLLENGEADIALSHAPKAEADALARHVDWSYRKFAWNRFIIVGPRNDPARVADARDAIDAFRRIADSHWKFVSRGDESGTHEREESLWQAASTRPSSDRLIISGRGMAQALRHTDEAQAYTLTDEPTFWQLHAGLDLLAVLAGDSRLLNTYAVLARKDDARANTFVRWIDSKEGRQRLREYNIAGKSAYQPWPDRCSAALPSDLPCQLTAR